MVLKPGTGSFGTVCRCQVLLENYNDQHLYRHVYQEFIFNFFIIINKMQTEVFAFKNLHLFAKICIIIVIKYDKFGTK